VAPIIQRMTRQLDVLIMENRRGAAHDAEAELVAAGHRVHRCHHADDRGFPCVGVTEPGTCPIDHGVDVALLVRHHVAPRPAPLEEGVSCIIRSGVPLVEDGPSVLDPFDAWVTERVGPELGIEATCQKAADSAYEPLRLAIRERIAAVLHAAGLTFDLVTCTLVPAGGGLRVELAVDAPVDRRLHQTLAVRVLDAVRSSSTTTYGQVDVEVTGRGDPAPA
jgi:hypothetical protein